MPIVVYAPEDFEVRYRVFAAGPEQSAMAGRKGNPVTNSPGKIQSHTPGEVISGGPSSGVVQGGPSGGVVSGGPSGGVVISGPSSGVTNGRTSGGPGFIPRRVIPDGTGSKYKDRTINSPVYGGPTRVSPPASGLASKKIQLLAINQYKIPPGSSATVRLYDAMQNGPENSFASGTTPIDNFATALTMPDFKMTQDIVMPAVDVSIYDPKGQLIFVNNQATMINYHGPTPLRMVRPGEDYDYDLDNAQDDY